MSNDCTAGQASCHPNTRPQRSTARKAVSSGLAVVAALLLTVGAFLTGNSPDPRVDSVDQHRVVAGFQTESNAVAGLLSERDAVAGLLSERDAVAGLPTEPHQLTAGLLDVEPSYGRDSADTPQFLTVPIRDLQVMHHRVMAHNPLREEVTESVGDINPEQWRVVTLVHVQPDGSQVTVQRGLPGSPGGLWRGDRYEVKNHTAEPLPLVAFDGEEVLRLGERKWISLPENGIEGHFYVTAIDPCPAPMPGDGQLVTTKFIHENAEVFDLIVGQPERSEPWQAPVGWVSRPVLTDPAIAIASVQSNGTALESRSTAPTAAELHTETIGVTAGHRFWSEYRQAFLPIGEFEVGEHLLTANGSLATVRSLTKRPQRETVYNIEVDGEHVFGVGFEGILVHNTCPVRDTLADGIKRKHSSWLKYKKKHGVTADIRRWSKKYDQLMTNKARGRWREWYNRKKLGLGTQGQKIGTPFGNRIPDAIDGNILREFKNGRVTMSPAIRRQIYKDGFLGRAAGGSHSIQWHLPNGASGSLIDLLKQQGISVVP